MCLPASTLDIYIYSIKWIIDFRAAELEVVYIHIGPRAPACRFVTLSLTLERASQSVGSWRCKTSLRGGRLVA
jgi:hypothetical protein